MTASGSRSVLVPISATTIMGYTHHQIRLARIDVRQHPVHRALALSRDVGPGDHRQ